MRFLRACVCLHGSLARILLECGAWPVRQERKFPELEESAWGLLAPCLWDLAAHTLAACSAVAHRHAWTLDRAAPRQTVQTLVLAPRSEAVSLGCMCGRAATRLVARHGGLTGRKESSWRNLLWHAQVAAITSFSVLGRHTCGRVFLLSDCLLNLATLAGLVRRPLPHAERMISWRMASDALRCHLAEHCHAVFQPCLAAWSVQCAAHCCTGMFGDFPSRPM